MRLAPLIAFLALTLVLAAALLYNPTAPKPSTQGIVGKAFPALIMETYDNKKPWDQAALNGQLTFINFLASWCMPCATEMPELAALKKQYPSLRMQGVAWNDDPATLKKWLKQHGNPFHAVYLDKKGDATIGLGIKGIPESFVVDGKGVVRYHFRGPINETTRKAELDPLLDALIAEQANAR